jgi:hypothetical protein
MNPFLVFVIRLMEAVAPDRDHTVIGNAIADVLMEEPEASRERLATRVVAVGKREGDLRENVVGDCTLGGVRAACSKPGAVVHSWCFMQINDSMGGSKWMNENPYQCVRRGVEILKMSERACPHYPIAFYASGPAGCDNRRAQRISNDRMALADWLYARRDQFRLQPEFAIVHATSFFER